MQIVSTGNIFIKLEMCPKDMDTPTWTSMQTANAWKTLKANC